MPLFPWDIAFQVLTTVLQSALDLHEDERGGTARRIGYLMREEMALAELLAQRDEHERSEDAKIERTRWLEEHRAERSFPCGIVPDPKWVDTMAPSPTAQKPVTPTSTDDESQPGWGAPLPSQPGWGMPDPSVIVPMSAEQANELPGADLKPMQVIAAVLPADLVFIREFGDDEEVDEVGRLPRNAIHDVDVVDTSGAHIPEPNEETFEPPKLAWTVLKWTNEGKLDEDRFAFRSPWRAWQAARRLQQAKA